MVKKLLMIKTLQEMRSSIINCGVIDLTFLHNPFLNNKDKEAIEKHLKYGFNLWSNSWLLPQIESLIAELKIK